MTCCLIQVVLDKCKATFPFSYKYQTHIRFVVSSQINNTVESPTTFMMLALHIPGPPHALPTVFLLCRQLWDVFKCVALSEPTVSEKSVRNNKVNLKKKTILGFKSMLSTPVQSYHQRP